MLEILQQIQQIIERSHREEESFLIDSKAAAVKIYDKFIRVEEVILKVA